MLRNRTVSPRWIFIAALAAVTLAGLYASLGAVGVMADRTLAALATVLPNEGDPSVTSPETRARIDPAVPKTVVRHRVPASAGRPAVIRVLNHGAVDEHQILARLSHPEADQPAASATPTPDDDLDPAGQMSDWFKPGVETYRTVCVRLCDGAMTPLSFATRRESFAYDALRCRHSCGSPARLYVQKNPATDADKLVDLDGRPYRALPTAYVFRTGYEQACTCRPHAWQTAARARHRMFAITEQVAAARRLIRDRMDILAAARTPRVALGKTPAGTRVVAAREHGPVRLDSRTVDPTRARAGATGSAASEAALGRDPASDLAGKQHAWAGAPLKVAAKAGGKAGQKSRKLAEAGKSRTAKRQIAGYNLKLASPGWQDGKGRQRSVYEQTSRVFDGNDWRINVYQPL